MDDEEDKELKVITDQYGKQCVGKIKHTEEYEAESSIIRMVDERNSRLLPDSEKDRKENYNIYRCTFCAFIHTGHKKDKKCLKSTQI